jgi:hypothetical protein
MPRYGKSTETMAEEHDRLGTEPLRLNLSPEGIIVAMGVDSGDFELGGTTFEAAERHIERHPDAQSWSDRIGYSAVYRFGGWGMPF